MKIFAPKYYTKFKCISSKCTHSCCIGWEIDVDKTTLSKYQNCNHPYASSICKSIKGATNPHFKLRRNGNCMHLDKNGLCKIILNLGEDHLCDICKEHPRFYNQTPYGLEVGLGLSCEEACRIILTSSDFNQIEEIGCDNTTQEEFKFNPIPTRDKILNVIANNDLSYKEKLQSLSNDFSISIQSTKDKDWIKLIKSLEYLKKGHKKLFSCFSTSACLVADNQAYLERIFAYFVYRYVSKAQSHDEIRQYLGLCLFLEKLVCSILEKRNAIKLEEIIPLLVTISEEIEYSEDNIDQILFQFI